MKNEEYKKVCKLINEDIETIVNVLNENNLKTEVCKNVNQMKNSFVTINETEDKFEIEFLWSVFEKLKLDWYYESPGKKICLVSRGSYYYYEYARRSKQ